MSVRTTADERLDQAVANISAAIDCLKQVVIDECWGAKDFTDESLAGFTKALHDLIDTRRRLKD